WFELAVRVTLGKKGQRQVHGRFILEIPAFGDFLFVWVICNKLLSELSGNIEDGYNSILRLTHGQKKLRLPGPNAGHPHRFRTQLASKAVRF
ncbi:MAG: hypothetical protein KGZ79_12650, partial [Dethiobacter sp.]|nr:hypothetical protein [Dethiobacter sp.]